VVCGDNGFETDRVAREIEEAVGPVKFHGPHKGGGLYGLPHWQQDSGVPAGHSFCETPLRKALT
jgi:hypothetical protein